MGYYDTFWATQITSSIVLKRIKLILRRKEALEMTAFATRLTRCRLIWLYCWAKINSHLMIIPSLFIYIFFYYFCLLLLLTLISGLIGWFDCCLMFECYAYQNTASSQWNYSITSLLLLIGGEERGRVRDLHKCSSKLLWCLQRLALSTGLTIKYVMIYNHLGAWPLSQHIACCCFMRAPCCQVVAL